MRTARPIVVAAFVIVIAIAAAFWLRAGRDITTADLDVTVPPTKSADTTPPPTAPPSISTPSPEATPPTADTSASGGETVARQSLITIFSWRPATDAGPADAYLRAKPNFSAALATAATDATAPAGRGPGLQWDQWRAANATITATVTLGCSGCPPDQPEQIARVATITQTVTTPGHPNTIEPSITVWITVIREAGIWRLDRIAY